MALDNYDNLKQSIKKWSHREDIVGEIANDCIVMAENEIFYGANPIRLTEMIAETVTSSSSRTLAFPADMLELINASVEVQDFYHRLFNLPIQKMPDNDETGCPGAYSMTNQFTFDVIPDKAYNFKFEYYQKPEALSDANTSNIVLQKYPLIYFYGGMTAAMNYAGEEDRMNEYAIRMRDMIARANGDADNLLYGSLPTTFIDGAIP